MSYRRYIKDHLASSQQVDGFTGIEDVTTWLEARAKTYQMRPPCYLLAHANDGVIWGRLDENGRLLTSHDALINTNKPPSMAQSVLPPLRSQTLQQVRLFNDEAELYIWHDGEGGWNGRFIQDSDSDDNATWQKAFDENYLLWGTYAAAALENDFTLVADGVQGLYHAVPIVADPDKKPLYLQIRHYLVTEGMAQVDASRLVAIAGEFK
jgi:CRISPR-associated protein (TIGR03984 family)